MTNTGKAMLPLERWAMDSESSRYPFLEYPDRFNVAASAYDWQPDRNPYSGKPVRCVDVAQASPGNFSYLPLASFVRYADNSTRDGLGGYLLVLWGGRVLPEDARAKGRNLRLPIACIITSGMDIHWTGDPLEDPAPLEQSLETVEEAFAEAGLGNAPAQGGSTAPLL